MTETVNSGYNTIYWVKRIGITVLIFIFAIIFSINYAESSASDTLTTKILTAVLVMALVALYSYKFFANPRRSITISVENIIIYDYWPKNYTIINYADIDKIRTLRSSGGLIYADLNNYQILEMELIDGTLLRFGENEFENYSTMKAAIYDHKFRGL